MIYGFKRSFPVFSAKTIQRNLILLILGFPTAGLFIFFVLSPASSYYHISSDYQDAPARNDEYVQVRIKHNQKVPQKNYTIHIWQHGERLKRRFLRSYGNRVLDPYRTCSVRNCLLTTDDQLVEEADAVLFHLHRTKGPQELPKDRPSGQIWIFFTDESPYHTFYASRKYEMSDYNGLFNWSMTYRHDSDVPVPYGRTVPLTPEEKRELGPLPSFAARKNSTIAILGSNCGGINHRWDYVKELQKYIDLDIYGGCGNLTCPGHFTRDCPTIAGYKFYLAFENSNCREYMTEKLWWNAYHKDVVPVVMGAPREDLETFCPPNSFIYVDDFKNPGELASYLHKLDGNETAYNEFFQWKKSYKVVNEHGYFGSPSFHLCRICEKLNAKYPSPKTYDDLASFWSVKTDCRKSPWKPKRSKKRKKGRQIKQ